LAEKKELESANEQLKKTLGEQTLEVSILRDLLKKANPHLRTK
jgi:transposase